MREYIFTHQQVAESCQKMEPIVVFGKASIADLVVTKDLFDVSEGMLHFVTV